MTRAPDFSPDVVYPLRCFGGVELRYSLRSLRNLPHGRVFVAGDCPEWARVTHIETTRYPHPFVDAQRNILAACDSDRVSDPFVLMNDDFFITRAVGGVPVLSRGRMRVVVDQLTARYGSIPYVRGLVDSLHGLREAGFDDPHCFELHVPMMIRKAEFVEAVRMGWSRTVWTYRSAFGAVAGLTPDDVVSDVKAISPVDRVSPGVPFVSTSDAAFAVGLAGEWIRSEFPVKSEYER